MENRVLTLEEVLALPKRTKVWVEISQEKADEWKAVCAENDIDTGSEKPDGIFTKGADGLHNSAGFWPLDNTDGLRGMRVWLREPTPAELAANPWP